jgi:hypothetical protein
MRLALLGSDHELQTLLRDLPAEHTIVAAFDAAEPLLPLGALLPQVERGENWESLLVRDDVDLVIVASPRNLLPTADGMDPQARRVDQLKKLAGAGVNLLVSHPAADLLDAYEIEMLRREGGGLIRIWFPGYWSPIWETISQQTSLWKQSAGGVAVQWTRRVGARKKADVLEALARDLLLIEDVIGFPKRVIALSGSAADESGSVDWSRLSVQIVIADGPVVRWELAPAAQISDWEIVLEHADDVQKFVIAGNDADELQRPLSSLRSATRLPATLPAEKESELLKACRSLEALAAVEKSLQRGRTIEVAQSEQSEEHNFKGVMASAGCLLLFLILFAVFVVALVEGLRLPLRDSALWRLWPLALIVPLAIFLGLQFLQTVIQKPQSR